MEKLVTVETGTVSLEGNLAIPEGARGVVLFAHGSGSSRHSPRNIFVARELQQAGLATLLIDLLTGEEEIIDRQSRHLRFDISLLAERLVAAVDWLRDSPEASGLDKIGCFGASTGAAAALTAAARRPEAVAAVVSRGGRPDLAADDLPCVRAPTLLIVGAHDTVVSRLNQAALAQLTAAPAKEMVLVPRATHLFEEPGALEQVALLARNWFRRYLSPQQSG